MYINIHNERAHSIQQTNDGGFVIVGETTSFGAGGKDWFVMKTDANGMSQWTKTFGSTSDEDGLSISVKQTSDNGYIICGETTSFGAMGRGPYIVKIDNSGTVLWEKRITGSGNDFFRDVIETQSGNYLFVGTANSYGSGNSDFYAVMVSSTGTLLWTNTYGGISTEHAVSVIEISRNSFIITGSTETYGVGSDDGLLVNIDENGTVGWSKAYGGVSKDVFISSVQVDDENIVSVGYTETYGSGVRSVYAVKTDTSGNAIWTKVYGGNSADRGVNVDKVDFNEIIISAVSNSTGFGSNDNVVITVNSSGTIVRTKAYGGVANDEIDLWGGALMVTSDSSTVIAGGTYNFSATGEDIYIMKTNSCGETYCNDSDVVFSELSPSIATTIVSLSTGSGGVLTNTLALTSNPSFTLNTLCSSNLVGVDQTQFTDEEFQLYPNPNNGHFSIDLSSIKNIKQVRLNITDISGKSIKNFNRSDQNKIIKLDLGNIVSGVYFVNLLDENTGSLSQMKFIIIK